MSEVKVYVKTKPKRYSTKALFPNYYANKYGEEYMITVDHNQLTSFGIYPGDKVYYQSCASDLNEEDLYVWESSAELYEDGKSVCQLAYASDCFGEIYLFRCGDYFRYKKKDIRLLGQVIKIERPYVPQGNNKLPLTEKPEKTENTEEKSFTCDQCGATLKGSMKFAKGMGWRLRKSETLCLSCW